nr:hypothetical protein [Thermoanaerobacterium sp. RBIITD]
MGRLHKSGTWYSCGDIRLGQGRENGKQYLKDNKEVADKIEGKIRENINLVYGKIQPADDETAN